MVKKTPGRKAKKRSMDPVVQLELLSTEALNKATRPAVEGGNKIYRSFSVINFPCWFGPTFLRLERAINAMAGGHLPGHLLKSSTSK